jgi:hypothetical protein
MFPQVRRFYLALAIRSPHLAGHCAEFSSRCRLRNSATNACLPSAAALAEAALAFDVCAIARAAQPGGGDDLID